MSTLDDIAQERQRVAERLAKIDAERAKLAEELAELEAAERVLSRFGQLGPRTGRRGRRIGRAEAAAPAEPGRKGQRRRRPRGAAPARSGISLGNATLHAVAAHDEGASAEQVREYLGREFGMQVRPNHLGMALQRHRRGGRLEQRDGRWFSLAAQAD